MDNNGAVTEESVSVSLDDLAARMDALGTQMNWLCENLQSLFLFVSQVNNNGGGLRGIMSLLKHAPPQIQTTPTDPAA